jgi:hypothetical protein
MSLGTFTYIHTIESHIYVYIYIYTYIYTHIQRQCKNELGSINKGTIKSDTYTKERNTHKQSVYKHVKQKKQELSFYVYTTSVYTHTHYLCYTHTHYPCYTHTHTHMYIHTHTHTYIYSQCINWLGRTIRGLCSHVYTISSASASSRLSTTSS